MSFQIDTEWKLGLIGRNGRGKTTFLTLLMGKYPYSGTITSKVEFEYFPYPVEDQPRLTLEAMPELWKLAVVGSAIPGLWKLAVVGSAILGLWKLEVVRSAILGLWKLAVVRSVIPELLKPAAA